MSDFSQSGGLPYRNPSSFVNAKVLLAGVAERDTIPSGYQLVFISSTNNVFTKFGDSSVIASIPNDVSNGSAAELNSSGYHLGSGHTHISIISDVDCIATLAYYKVTK